MTKSLTKVIYKPDSQSTDEYLMFVNHEEYGKWKAGDKSIPLADVVDSFDVFHSGQGNQGHLGRPSHQDLDNIFGTHKDIDVALQILEKGTSQAADELNTTRNDKNIAKGDMRMDNKGSGARLSGA